MMIHGSSGTLSLDDGRFEKVPGWHPHARGPALRRVDQDFMTGNE